MVLTFVNLNRFTTPSGVCVAVCNLITCISGKESVSSINLIVGNWQVDYYKEKLNIHLVPKVNIIAVNLPNTSFRRNYWFIWKMNQFVKDADTVILSYPIPFLRILFKCPVVSILHDLYAFDYPENFGFPSFYLNRAQFFLNLKNTNGYICVSETTKKSLIKKFGKKIVNKKIETIYNYIPINHNSQKPLIKINTNQYWLCVAQHRKNKNLITLINVYIKSLENKIIDKIHKLVIVGSEGPSTMQIKKIIKDNCLENSIILISNLQNDEITWLFKNTNLFILPSSIEGFGMPLIEAGLFSNRIVASDIPIFRELIANISFFSLTGNIEENLFFAIKECLITKVKKPLINPQLLKETISKNFFLYLQDLNKI